MKTHFGTRTTICPRCEGFKFSTSKVCWDCHTKGSRKQISRNKALKKGYKGEEKVEE